jgi:DNA-binding IclR family transcriptional regulator
MLALAAPALRRFGIREVAVPVLRRLNIATEETTSLYLRIGTDRVCIDGVESPHPLRRVVALGERIPLRAGGASGRVILAFSKPDQQEKSGEDQSMKRIRSEGYCIAIGDRTPGVAALSAPIFDAAGVYGSITVAGPAERWTKARMIEFSGEIVAAGRAISSALGGEYPNLPITVDSDTDLRLALPGTSQHGRRH